MLLRKVIWYDFDNFRLEVETRRLLKDSIPLMLPPKAFQTLLILIERAGEIVEKDKIYNQLWTDSFVEEGNLSQHIYVLRKTLGYSNDGHSYIETVARQGYRFTAEVRAVYAGISVEIEDETKDSECIEQSKTIVADRQTALEKNVDGGELTEFSLSLNDEKEESENGRFHTPDYAANADKEGFRRGKLIALALISFVTVSVGICSYFYYSHHKEKSAHHANRKIKSLAVLPFKVIGEENGNDYLGLGITDAIITRLGKLKQIPVRPTSAVFRIEDAQTTPEKIGRELQVDAILEGTTQRSSNWVRISVRLILVETGETVWADTFDGEYTHIFKLQDDISAKVVDSLALNLSPVQKQNIKNKSTQNTEAYEAYVLGIYFWNKRTRDELQKAERYFMRAIELDPQYAEAYAGLADTYNMLAFNRFVPLTEVGEKAKNAALKAIQLDETIAEGHLALAQVQFAYEKNNEAGIKSLERAIELSPYNATARLRYGWRMLASLRLDAAEREMRLAQEYDPLSPVHNVALCNILILSRKYGEAVKFCERALEIDRNVPGGRTSLAEAYLLSGKTEQAIVLASEAVKENSNDLYQQGFLGFVYAYSGKHTEALKIASRLRTKAEKSPFLYIDLALIEFYVGRKKESFQYLDSAIKNKTVARSTIIYDPKFDEVKKDSQFPDLIKRYGLTLNQTSR